MIATGLLVVNNLRDIDEDRVANKRTLAVRFGATFSRWQYTVCIVGCALVPVAFVWIRSYEIGWTPLLASLTLIPGVVVIHKVWTRDGLDLRPFLGMTAGLLLMYTVLFCVGLGIG